jgi:hypothetical protein
MARAALINSCGTPGSAETVHKRPNILGSEIIGVAVGSTSIPASDASASPTSFWSRTTGPGEAVGGGSTLSTTKLSLDCLVISGVGGLVSHSLGIVGSGWLADSGGWAPLQAVKSKMRKIVYNLFIKY